MTNDGIFVVQLITGAFFVMPLCQSCHIVFVHAGLAVVSRILFIVYIIYTGITV